MPADWFWALVGGGLIGLSATIHLLLNGRVTGISGIYFGVFSRDAADRLWRIKFIVGLLLGGLLVSDFGVDPFGNESGRVPIMIAFAGFLVGFGTKLGSGCTSGHGVCGISRLSLRSIVATLVFMAAGVATVSVVKMFL